MRGRQVPECPPDTPWPVEPKPPRAVEEPEPLDVLVPVLLRPLELSAVETDVGAVLRENHPPEWLHPDE
jgi:hypothetical protein